MDCRVRFNYYNLRDSVVEEKGGWIYEKTIDDSTFSPYAGEPQCFRRRKSEAMDPPELKRLGFHTATIASHIGGLYTVQITGFNPSNPAKVE
jgi:hypothetical protein